MSYSTPDCIKPPTPQQCTNCLPIQVVTDLNEAYAPLRCEKNETPIRISKDFCTFYLYVTDTGAGKAGWVTKSICNSTPTFTVCSEDSGSGAIV